MTPELLWKNVLADVKKEVSQANFFAVFKQAQLLSVEEDVATIATPSFMSLNMIEKRFGEMLKNAFSNHCQKDIRVAFVTKSVLLNQKFPQDAGPLFADEEKKTTPLTVGHLPRVRAEYTFPNFAVSGSNQLAWAAATTVAGNIGNVYNPLFIYGPVGVGKTHLMHAIANEVYQKTPEKKIIYITSEEFTNEVVEAIRNNDTSRMKKRFRSASLLLIDDIQFVEGKERVQEELFHTFNILIDNGSQICLSSDRPPHEIKKLEKRLSSRFAGGLTVDIEAPDFELKTAILLKKAEKFGHDLPIDVAKLIADNAQDTRSLEGLLLRVITLATTRGEEVSLELAKRSLNGMYEEKREHIHAEDVIKVVCEYYGMKATLIKGPKRDASLVRARQVIMYLLKNELGLTLVEIGNLLGGRDHTTIMHGVEKIENQVAEKERISVDISGIKKTLSG